MADENLLYSAEARRKGRGQKPCTLQVAFTDDGPENQVVLRAIDQGGVEPIVAVLSPDEARRLGVALITAAAQAE